MFNFTVMNQALTDVNVSDKEFRMLYLFVNNASLNETDDIVMYNGFLMDKLNLSERQVQRLTKSLVDKGYLTKVVTGTSTNKNGNVYRLNDINDTDSDMTCDKSCDKNVTPYNSIKEYKNNISMYTDHEAEVTTEQVKLSKDELNQRNEYISAVYGKLDDRLNYLYGLKSAPKYVDVCTEITEIISAAQEHRDWFTEPQWDKLTRYCERFVKLTEAKDNYFNGNTKIYKDESSSIEEEKASAHIPSADEADIISTDDNITSTEDEPTEEVESISDDSTNDDFDLTDRFAYSQFEDRTPPSSARPPLTEEFNQHVRAAIRNGVYQWSLTLTEIPDYITGDNTNPIVSDALRAQPDYENYLGNISFMELTDFAKELMENRLNNKDIPHIVRQNQYNKRHEAFRKELMTA